MTLRVEDSVDEAPDVEVQRLTAEKLRLEIEEKRLTVEALSAGKAQAQATPSRSRMFSIVGAIGELVVHRAIDVLGTWHRETPGERIEVLINSQGGSIMDGLALFDFIQRVRAAGTPVDTTVVGMAASMGGVLAQMGEVRRISKRAWFMVHEASMQTWGTTSQIKDEQELLEALQKQTTEILAERSTLSVRQITNRTKRKDWWMDADDAVKFGFADEVV